jgi:hypothetical protein
MIVVLFVVAAVTSTPIIVAILVSVTARLRRPRTTRGCSRGMIGVAAEDPRLRDCCRSLDEVGPEFGRTWGDYCALDRS